MTAEPSPRPWRVEENSLGWKSCIEDADGKQIASCWGGDGVNCTEPAQSDAALIVDAVNERDRLRDLVRRFADLTDSLIANYEYRYRDDQNSMAFVGNVRDFIREARAAIGEDNP